MATVSVKQVFGVFHEWDQGDSRLHTNDPKCGLFSTIVWRVRIILFNPFKTHYIVNTYTSEYKHLSSFKNMQKRSQSFFTIGTSKGVYLRVSLKFVKYFPRLNLGHACSLRILL